MPPIDRAGRVIAGLLGYNPGPGIYSRLERAVQAMPATVRVEELPGLLKRYKEGVPGWELREADFPGLVGGAKVIPRQDLLDRVREHSPVFTHGEVVLGGRPIGQYDSAAHGLPKYKDYGHGGSDYTEVLLVQPGAGKAQFGSHWSDKERDAVAHARFDTHGDALRINELQSDLGIYNRKMREQYAEYQRMMRERGREPGPMEFQSDQPLPFPLEDAWSDLLIKRLALEAARKGHRAIEIASPRAIADKVGGNIENYEHFYGKVVPGAIERLGRKMGGLTEQATIGFDPEILRRVQNEIVPGAAHASIMAEAAADYGKLLDNMSTGGRLDFRGHMGQRLDALAAAADAGVFEMREANRFRDALSEMIYAEHMMDPRAARITTDEARRAADQLMPSMMARAAERRAIEGPRLANYDAQQRLHKMKRSADAPRRYLMSDEMRKRILTSGIGASLLAPIATMQDE